jgi:hypothetical protein
MAYAMARRRQAEEKAMRKRAEHEVVEQVWA